jgi:hypothetical protein
MLLQRQLISGERAPNFHQQMIELFRHLNLRPRSIPNLDLPPVARLQLCSVQADLLDILWNIESLPRYIDYAFDIVLILQSELHC